MSGPIVRRYGFPNSEKILAQREIRHGADEANPGESEPEPGSEDRTTADASPRLPADLPHPNRLVDPDAPDSGGTIAPSTEFGQASD